MIKDFSIGIITGARALKGEANVFPTTCDINRFALLKTVRVKLNGEFLPADVEYASAINAKRVAVKFKGADTPEAVLRLKGGVIYISRDEALPLEDGEYYTADLININVFDENGVFLGAVTDVAQTSANDVLTVEKNGEKPFYLPFIKQCVLNVDIARGKMTARVLEGLR